MPLYDYHCAACGPFESIVQASSRDVPQPCPTCQADVLRAGVQAFGLGKPAYQCKAILGSGQKVAGHFGKAAAVRRGGK